MAVNGFVLEPAVSLLQGPVHGLTRSHPERLFAALDSLQQITDPGALLGRAALEVLEVSSAAGAMVYLDSPDEGAQMAFSGTLGAESGEPRAALLRRLLAAPATPPFALLDRGETLVARLGPAGVAGAVLAERPGHAFSIADGYLLAALARQLGTLVFTLSLVDRLRRAERAGAAAAGGSGRTAATRRPAGEQALLGFDDLVGRSPAIARVRETCRVAAASSSSLVIEGESGVGKELLAQAVHSGGSRRAGPFVAVHCAAIPRDLLESELFGYERGAFTGADPHGHPGKFELADRGTLLLDDVVELPLEMQAKLLRVLQERSVTRLGGRRPRRIDVRIVATTNVPLPGAVEAGRFRPDLFYRLNVLQVAVPPLRERREDIGPLAEHFLRKYAPLHERRLRSLGPEALRALEAAPWPGNVRELEHWIESEVHFASPEAERLERLGRTPAHPAPARCGAPVRAICEVEREAYAAAIAATGGDVSRAARQLGISRGKLYRKLRRFGLLQR